MTTITDARAREFWCAVFLQSMRSYTPERNFMTARSEWLADAADDADIALDYFASRFGDRQLRDAVEELCG